MIPLAPEVRTAIITLLLIASVSLLSLILGETRTSFASHQTITDDESYDEEYDDYTDWIRRTSSSLRRKIDRLDEDAEDEFVIPILFGVTLDDITPNFGDPRGGGTRTHEGLDMLAPEGTPIVTPTEAVVIRTGSGSSAGRYVYTANPGGETFVYMHLDEIADIESGDVLDEGELIGYVGDTGNANGVSHLHFEVREGGGATDPYPRILEEYTLEEKIELLESILVDVRNEDDLADFLVDTFSGTFLIAENRDLDLPDPIVDALEESGFDISITDVKRDLELDDEGSDVVTLQTFLIALESGPASRELAQAGATGYFGPVTRAALIEYQDAVGIVPATGYFGPSTRAKIQGESERQATNLSGRDDGSVKPTAGLSLIATLIPRDLTIGSTGPEVQILQLFLIIKRGGPAAQALFEAGATGYFGPITAAAFREYQMLNNISPTGIYDQSTRTFISVNG